MYSLPLAHIPEHGTREEPGVDLAIETLELAPPFKGKTAKVGYKLTRMAEKVYGHLWAEGSLGLQCGRCLCDFDQAVRSEFMVQFEPATQALGEDRDADAEMTIVFYQGEELNLGEEIRQELELNIPFAPVCKKGCKGLCPHCGADLNQGLCGCDQGTLGPFAGLAEALKKKEQHDA